MKLILPLFVISLFLSSVLILDICLLAEYSFEEEILFLGSLSVKKRASSETFIDSRKVIFEENGRFFLDRNVQLEKGELAKCYVSPILNIPKYFIIGDKKFVIYKTIYNSWRKGLIIVWWLASLIVCIQIYRRKIDRDTAISVLIVIAVMLLFLYLYGFIVENMAN